MGRQSGKENIKKSCAGLLAHVDAGKTTLSESMLLSAGVIRKGGRVDHGDSFLDYDAQERSRGITIFSKQAILTWKGTEFTFIDTPGHVDFSAEMERTLSVLDYAVVLISGTDGVQPHTETIWKLLELYHIPAFIFVNKMDISHLTQAQLEEELCRRLDERCVSFMQDGAARDEAAALCDDAALNEYMEHGSLGDETLRRLVRERKLFPCVFGSALKMEQVDRLLDVMDQCTEAKTYPEEFGARVYKVSQDEHGSRLTHLKVTGGTLKVRTKLYQEEKADQLRRYCGGKYTLVNEVHAGEVCAVKGIRSLVPGEGLGYERQRRQGVLTSSMSYRVVLPEGGDAAVMWRHLQELAQEDPQLHVSYQPQNQELRVRLMGEIQTEVLKQIIAERYHVQVGFEEGSVVYKETLLEPVEGIGHYEPLRHYAEVHVLLEPLPPGSGLQFASACREDDLALNWQRLILTHMQEQEHPGVLTGSAITDLRITLLSGRAHLKHTEGGDFRQATYRAIRHGLRKGKSILLEPYDEFRMELPPEMMSRAIYDIEQMGGTFVIQHNDAQCCVLSGSAPSVGLNAYASKLAAFTRGRGRLQRAMKGYAPCHDAEEVISRIGYDCERDLEHPCGSVFCAHGAGFYVPWDEVEEHMHLPLSFVQPQEQRPQETVKKTPVRREGSEDEELMAIFARTYGPQKRRISDRESYARHEQQREQIRVDLKQLPACLLVDGYNVIHDWEELRALAQDNLDAARHRLIQILSNYQGYRQCTLIIVFDAYKVKDNQGSMQKQDNIYVVYTKTAQTADSYIESATHRLAKEFRVTVATSDGMEQLIAIGQGASRMSARQLKLEVEHMAETGFRAYAQRQKKGGSRPLQQLRELAVEEEDPLSK